MTLKPRWRAGIPGVAGLCKSALLAMPRGIEASIVESPPGYEVTQRCLGGHVNARDDQNCIVMRLSWCSFVHQLFFRFSLGRALNKLICAVLIAGAVCGAAKAANLPAARARPKLEPSQAVVFQQPVGLPEVLGFRYCPLRYWAIYRLWRARWRLRL